jgi:AraC-like DNA-binding protein
VPRDRAPRWLQERQCHGLTLDSSRALGGLLVNHLTGLGAAATKMTVDEGIAGIEAALMLAESALVHSDRLHANDNQNAYRNLRTEAAKLIDRELFNPDLCVERLIQELGVSRATLFRAFSESGGINLYIKHRRLQKARVALLRRVGHRPTIGEIARAHGFVSESHFSRAFREFCGQAPGALSTTSPLLPPQPEQDNAMRYDVLLGWMKGGRG